MRIIWLIEDQIHDGKRIGFSNQLPKQVQVDGWINYSVGILDQHIISTYCIEHTASLILRLIQGFFENKLTNPVTKDKIRIDKTGEQRSHGVYRASSGLMQMLSVLPNLKTNVATELANTGMSFSEIVAMSKNDLLAVNGIGEKSAEAIYTMFNRREEK